MSSCHTPLRYDDYQCVCESVCAPESMSEMFIYGEVILNTLYMHFFFFYYALFEDHLCNMCAPFSDWFICLCNYPEVFLWPL